ncbi:uncharacterized protein LOC119745619 isoform X2 [Patiria miniata]|uniref:Uncharacterized protein n=1 Tax=Patiria miniata TaxID=46514 RepID=A0A914BP38_PATMI|nr:uncharacterized protein LOC119745619 isoform X2 [Patiria miniata]
MMLNMHYQYLRYLPVPIYLSHVLFVCGMLQLCGADRGSKFSQGPDGEMCILREDHAEAAEFTYDHVDDSGHSCKCDLCPRGKILHRACVCDPNSSGYLEPSDCRLVNVGEQMMPDRNNCTKGFDCRKCNHPWVVEVQCGLHGTDTVCRCADGYYRASEEQCKPDPRCNKGFEPIITEDGGGFSERSCEQCRPGYYQPNQNSTDKCRPHTNCTKWAGTNQADAQCLNGPSTGGDPSEESKPSDVLNGTYVTGNATGPTVHPMDEWKLFFRRGLMIGIAVGVVVTLIGFLCAHLLSNLAWYKEHFGTENQRGDDNAGEASLHGGKSMDNINEDNESAALVEMDNDTNEAVDRCSRNGSPHVLQMNPDDHSARKAKQEQGPKRQRSPSSSSKNSGSSEDQLSLISANKYPRLFAAPHP